MKKIFIPFFLCLFFAPPIQALELSKGLPHYMREMEFYYQNPRPEILTPLLENLNGKRALARGENRLMLAAFLAELAKKGKLNLREFISRHKAMGKDVSHTLAWAAHLSGLPDEDALLGQALDGDEKPFLTQIKRAPRRLLSWPLTMEKSVLQMYWTAFMASGDPAYPDAVIQSALNFAKRQDSPSGQRDPHGTGSAAAASLYDFASAHKIVRERVKESLKGKRGNEEKILKMILRQ